MGRRPFYSAALAAIILTAASSTIATADNQPAGYLSVWPYPADPGQTLTLRVFGECNLISSIDAPMLDLVQQRVTDATMKVRANAKPGSYEAKVACWYGENNSGGLWTYTSRFRVVEVPHPDPLSISPKSARPGQTVTIETYESCSYHVEFSSPVLTFGQQQPDPDGLEITAPATVNADAKPGRYPVSATCYHGFPPKADTLTIQFTVAKEPVPQGQPAAHQVKQVPKGAAQTGGGGTASQG